MYLYRVELGFGGDQGYKAVLRSVLRTMAVHNAHYIHVVKYIPLQVNCGFEFCKTKVKLGDQNHSHE